MTAYILRPSVLVVVLVWFFVVVNAAAQDAHYWTLQYGPKSSLLGGAVIGSVDDVSATFYNPGALARARSLSFAVSTNVFEISKISLENGGGQGVDIGRQVSGLRPSMVAGTVADSLFGGKGVLGYSAMNRLKGSQDLEGQIGLESEEIDPDLNLKDLLGIVRFEGEFSDFWAGLTYGHRLGRNFGIGATGYLAARSQNRRLEALDQAISTSREGRASVTIASGSYTAVRLLAKIGLFARFADLTAGVTLTTPGANIYGDGELSYNSGTFTPDSAGLAYTLQKGLPTVYKSPLSIGGGVGLPVGPLRIHASAEWFDRIDPYVVIQGRDIHAQEPENVVIPIDAVHEVDAVLNWGVGCEFDVSRKFTGYLSYYQDNSSLGDDIERSSLAVMPFDIETLLLGTDFEVGPARLTLGLGYGWGEKMDTELTNVIDPEGDRGLEALFVFRSLRALFGFEVGV